MASESGGPKDHIKSYRILSSRSKAKDQGDNSMSCGILVSMWSFGQMGKTAHKEALQEESGGWF